MKAQNLPPTPQQIPAKAIVSQEAAPSEAAKGDKALARLSVGDIISVKVEQQLAAGKAIVSFQGNRFTALSDTVLRQGEVFKALIESLGSEIKLKPLLGQIKNLDQKLTSELKSLIGSKEKSSDTAKWAKALVNAAKGELPPKSPAAAPQAPTATTTAAAAAAKATAPTAGSTAGPTTASPKPEVLQQPAIPLTRKEIIAKAEATLNLVKNIVASAKEALATQASSKVEAQQNPAITKEGQVVSSSANAGKSVANPFAAPPSNTFSQARYLQAAAETTIKTDKPLNLGTLLANAKAAPLIRENILLLDKIIDRTVLVPDDKPSKEAVMNLMRDSGLQLEKKIAALVRDGTHHEFPKMAEKDLKGQLLKLKGDLQQMSQDKTLNLPQNIKEEILSLQKEVTTKINNIELNQVLNTISKDRDNSMLFQLPFMQNEEIKNSVLEYKRKKSENKDEPDELAISFFLEMSNIGELRIDGLLIKKNFHGVINVASDEAATVFRQNLHALSKSMEAYGIIANIGVKKVSPQSVAPPENTDFLKSDEFRDSILDLKV